jgi:hypothetical protein
MQPRHDDASLTVRQRVPASYRSLSPTLWPAFPVFKRK